MLIAGSEVASSLPLWCEICATSFEVSWVHEHEAKVKPLPYATMVSDKLCACVPEQSMTVE